MLALLKPDYQKLRPSNTPQTKDRSLHQAIKQPIYVEGLKRTVVHAWTKNLPTGVRLYMV